MYVKHESSSFKQNMKVVQESISCEQYMEVVHEVVHESCSLK